MIKFEDLKQDIRGLIKNEPKYERAATEDQDEIEVKGSASSSSTTRKSSVMWHNVTDFANIFKSFMGSGYLSNPFAYHQAGIGLGFIAMVFVAIATTHCCQLAVHCKKQIIKNILSKQFPDQNQTKDPKMAALIESKVTEAKQSLERSLTLQDIANISLGVWGLRTVNLALFITQFGFCTSYIIFLGKTLQHLFGGIDPGYAEEEEAEKRALAETVQFYPNSTEVYDFYDNTTDLMTTVVYNQTTNIPLTTALTKAPSSHGPSYTVLVLSLYPIFVIYSLIRKIRNIGPISVVSNIINMSAYVAIMGYLMKHYTRRDDIEWSKWSSFPIFYGMMTGAYEGLGTIIPIESSMEGNREWYPLLLHSALFLYTIFMAGIGMVGYLVYGEDVHQVIVWNLPHDSLLVRMLNIALLLNVLSTFPIQLFPAIETVEGLVFARNQQPVTYEQIEMQDMGEHTDMDKQLHQNGMAYQGHHQMPTSTKDIVEKAPTWKRNMVRVMIVTVMVVIALIFEHVFAYFGAFVGALGCSIISFILPCLMHLYIHGVKSLSRRVVFKDVFLVSVGVLGATLGIYTSTVKIIKHVGGHK